MIKVLGIALALVAVSFASESIQTSTQKDGKIVGGTPTTIEKYPYLVSIRYNTLHRCGGSIFTYHTVVVAANCVVGLSAEYFVIVAGSTKRSEPGVERLVKEIIMHEDFDAFYRKNDIALLILSKPFFFTSRVQAISPAGSIDSIRPGERAYIIGWGGNIDGEFIQDNLHITDLYIIDNEECGRKYKGYFEITDDMFCAVPWVGVRGSCYGDFGGPLVIQGKVHGIILWPLGCGEKTFPSIFLKVSAFRGWISQQLMNRGMMKDLKQMKTLIV